MKSKIPYFFIIMLVIACTPPQSSSLETEPDIYPDYKGITIPSNIASLNFMIEEEAAKYITLFEAGGEQFTVRGQKVSIPLHRWHNLIAKGDVKVTVFVKRGDWYSLKPFYFHVTEEIDPYITYRLIPPSFQTYNRLSINQRNITNFKERVIYANTMASADAVEQCINCHNFRNWHTDSMQFHIRHQNAGTVFYMNGKLSKLNLKTDSTISAAVYPSWHPTHDYIAYSNNRTFQNIHTNHTDRMQAFDEFSDLVLYDINNNSVSVIENQPDEFECHPIWTPDGKTLYYVSAHIDNLDLFMRNGGPSTGNESLKYNLYSKRFNPENKKWGKSELYFDAAAVDSSLTWPRISPDGTKLLACLSSYGVFPPYQSEAELIIFDLENGTHRYLDEINSDYAESYHSWSSNGHWIVFSTRREDGIFTRIYLSYMNKDGIFTKPFPVPQKDPYFSRKFMYSFNIPEFSVDPIKISARKLASFVNSTEAGKVSFDQKREE